MSVETKQKTYGRKKLEPQSTVEFEEQIETHLILKCQSNKQLSMTQSAQDNNIPICPIAFNVDVDVEECDAELEAAVANLNSFYKPAEETEYDTCVVYETSQTDIGSGQCMDDTVSCMETSTDVPLSEENTELIAYDNSENSECSIDSDRPKKTKKRNDSLLSLFSKIPYRGLKDSVKPMKICKLNEKVVFEKLDELSETELSKTDQILLVEARNSWGRVLFKQPKRNQHDIKIKICLEEKWRPWQSAATRYRDYPLSYKCYLCGLAWWHLYPFREHINNNIHIDIILNLEIKGHECSVVAFTDKKPPATDISIENECWRCGNDFNFHIRELQTVNSLYTCQYCTQGFSTCFLLKEHLPGCLQYRKSLRTSREECLQFYKCHLCKILMTSKEDSFKHYSNYHDVRSDLPIITNNKFCAYCNQFYSIKLLHICPKRNSNMSCQYCQRRFPSKILLQMHTNCSIQDFRCRICYKVLGAQCMEARHLVGKHSEKFVIVPVCLKCDGNVLLLNDESVWMHTKTKHNRKFERRRNYVEMVVVPKDCLNWSQLAEMSMPCRQIRGVPDKSNLKDNSAKPDGNTINIVITKTESLVKDDIKIINIADPMEIFNDMIHTDQSNNDCTVQVTNKGVKEREEGSDKKNTKKHTFFEVFAEELGKTAIPMEGEVMASDVDEIVESVTTSGTQIEATSMRNVKVKEEPIIKDVVIKTETDDDTPHIKAQDTNIRKRTNENVDETLPAPKRNMIKFEDDLHEDDFQEDLITIKQEYYEDTILNDSTSIEDESEENVLRKVFGIAKRTSATAGLVNIKLEVKEEGIEEDDVTYVAPVLHEIEIISSSDEAEETADKSQEDENDNTEADDFAFIKFNSNIKVEPDSSDNEGEYAEATLTSLDEITEAMTTEKVTMKLKNRILRQLVKLKVFTCSTCKTSYDTFENYVFHLTEHDFEAHFCPVCTKKVRKGKVHVDCYMCTAFGGFSTKTDEKMKLQFFLECKICNSFVDANQRFVHWEEHLRHLCVESNDLEVSLQQDSSIKRLDKCSLDQIKSTLKQKKLKDRQCALCSKVLARQGELKRHLIEHLLKDAMARFEEHRGLKCQECPKTFQKSDPYRQHLREHSCMPVYRCEICSKCFSDSSNSAKHKKLHIDQLPECDLCGKKFHHLYTLARHIKEHEVIGVINCDHCDRVFYSTAALNKHKRMVKDKIGYRFPCAICRKKFKSVRTKWDHMWLVHKQRKEEADCPLCGESFRKYTDVRNHVVSNHPGKLPITMLKKMRASRDYYRARKELRPRKDTLRTENTIRGIKIEYESDS